MMSMKSTQPLQMQPLDRETVLQDAPCDHPRDSPGDGLNIFPYKSVVLHESKHVVSQGIGLNVHRVP